MEINILHLSDLHINSHRKGETNKRKRNLITFTES